MGKDDKEESGFGFKDKAKAEETLRLLEQHEPNYRRLTVRGLLGRAKRVLSLTKAEDKIKNITEAMRVFEDWLADLDKNKEKKPDKKEKTETEEKQDSDRSSSKNKKDSKSKDNDAGPVLGFKDEETANNSLKELDGRDPDYQKLAVKGLIQRAERVLTSTRDETKISNIKAAISIFNEFLDDFESQHLSKKNNSYISLGVVKTCVKLAEDVSELQKSFIAAYTSADGDYKRLRSVASGSGKTWDIVRNRELEVLKEKHADAKLFDDDTPTAEHLEMLLWAYSPEAAKVKKVIKEADGDDDDDEMECDNCCEEDEQEDKKEEREVSRKRKSSADDDCPSKKKK